MIKIWYSNKEFFKRALWVNTDQDNFYLWSDRPTIKYLTDTHVCVHTKLFSLMASISRCHWGAIIIVPMFSDDKIYFLYCVRKHIGLVVPEDGV